MISVVVLVKTLTNFFPLNREAARDSAVDAGTWGSVGSGGGDDVVVIDLGVV